MFDQRKHTVTFRFAILNPTISTAAGRARNISPSSSVCLVTSSVACTRRRVAWVVVWELQRKVSRRMPSCLLLRLVRCVHAGLTHTGISGNSWECTYNVEMSFLKCFKKLGVQL